MQLLNFRAAQAISLFSSSGHDWFCYSCMGIKTAITYQEFLHTGAVVIFFTPTVTIQMVPAMHANIATAYIPTDRVI